MKAIDQVSALQMSNIDFDYHIFKALSAQGLKSPFNIMIIDDNKKDIELFEDLLRSETQLNFSLSKHTNPSEAFFAKPLNAVALEKLL